MACHFFIHGAEIQRILPVFVLKEYISHTAILAVTLLLKPNI